VNDTRRPGRAVAPVVAVSVIPGVIPHTFDRERGASKAPCDRKLVVAMKNARVACTGGQPKVRVAGKPLNAVGQCRLKLSHG
jgi:hypothetical protein